jgi:hypothetical protein
MTKDFINLNPNIMYKAICLLIVVSFLGMGSCKKKSTDPDRCGTAWSTQLSTQINAVTAAAQAYGTDPSAANCNALKTAYQNYLNALEPFTDCAAWTAQQKDDLQTAIDEAQQQVNTLCQ